jgi:hypothetical protein
VKRFFLASFSLAWVSSCALNVHDVAIGLPEGDAEGTGGSSGETGGSGGASGAMDVSTAVDREA